MNPTYDADALRNDIKVARANIKRFQEAIATEYENISKYKKMIDEIEKKKRRSKG